jgi:carbonic anhydrase
MTRLMQGVRDFQRKIFGDKRELFEKLGHGQQPLALFITCSDSRIIPDMLAQTQPGELFLLRNIGNIVPPHGSGAGTEAAVIEYAVKQLRVREIIVCGHSHCGAMHGVLAPEALTTLPDVGSWLKHAKEAGAKAPPLPGETTEQRLRRVIEQNVLLQLEHVKSHPSVMEALANRTMRLHGWVYTFESGKVDVYDPLSGKFVPVQEQFRSKMLENADPESRTVERTIWNTHI